MNGGFLQRKPPVFISTRSRTLLGLRRRKNGTHQPAILPCFVWGIYRTAQPWKNVSHTYTQPRTRPLLLTTPAPCVVTNGIIYARLHPVTAARRAFGENYTGHFLATPTSSTPRRNNHSDMDKESAYVFALNPIQTSSEPPICEEVSPASPGSRQTNIRCWCRLCI